MGGIMKYKEKLEELLETNPSLGELDKFLGKIALDESVTDADYNEYLQIVHEKYGSRY